jgi:hypothetical protein
VRSFPQVSMDVATAPLKQPSTGNMDGSHKNSETEIYDKIIEVQRHSHVMVALFNCKSRAGSEVSSESIKKQKILCDKHGACRIIQAMSG